jgi:3-phenylpropionate/trans-cinnamate dioxygenase ferredoxin reductase subunit
VEAVVLADGRRTVPADVVVTGIGIQPNIELAAAAGLEVGDGIVVDDRCRTADPDIYAVGDCTLHPNSLIGRSVRLESVQNALEQARTAAANICGEDARYAEIPWFWSDQYDLKLQIAGLSQGYDRAVLRGDPDSRSFSCAYLIGQRIIALDAVNSPRDFLQAKRLIAERTIMNPEVLSDPRTELKDAAA